MGVLNVTPDSFSDGGKYSDVSAAVERGEAGKVVRGDGANHMAKDLDSLIEKLKAAAGANLQAVVLYGSAAAGEFHAKHSDLNTLCLVARASVAELEALQPAIEWWVRQGNSAPLVFTLEELRQSADIFAIELLDMKQSHRMLFGDDFFAGLEAPMNLHRHQVERELRANWIRLRRAYLLAPRRRSALVGLMTASLSSFVTLFRHALIAFGEGPPAGKRAIIERIAAIANANPEAFLTILELREGKQLEKLIDIGATLRGYMELVERVTEEVDRRFAAAS